MWAETDEAQQIVEEFYNGGLAYIGPSRPESPLRQAIINAGFDPDDRTYFTYEDTSNWVERSEIANRFLEEFVG